MNIFALDTCSEQCSIALRYQGVFYQNAVMTQRGHSDVLLSMMDNVLADAGASMAEVDVLAFGRGPGSFTGVRVGVSVAQGIAFARDIPVVPVSSLAAVAQTAGESLGQGHYAVAMDARMGEIYCAHYYFDGKLASLMGEERVCPPEDFDIVNIESVIGVGTAWQEYQTVLTQQFGDRLSAHYDEYYPDAKSIVTLAHDAAVRGDVLPAEQALPVYLRDNVAKKKAGQHG